MQSLNLRYRGMNRITDVLSFPMGESGGASDAKVLGDIVICAPRAALQAKRYGVSFYEELLRLLFHGLLHLLGYDHEAGSYQKRKMESKERELFDAVTTMD